MQNYSFEDSFIILGMKTVALDIKAILPSPKTDMAVLNPTLAQVRWI